jgi:hypothetical protein
MPSWSRSTCRPTPNWCPRTISPVNSRPMVAIASSASQRIRSRYSRTSPLWRVTWSRPVIRPPSPVSGWNTETSLSSPRSAESSWRVRRTASSAASAVGTTARRRPLPATLAAVLVIDVDGVDLVHAHGRLDRLLDQGGAALRQRLAERQAQGAGDQLEILLHARVDLLLQAAQPGPADQPRGQEARDDDERDDGGAETRETHGELAQRTGAPLLHMCVFSS